VRPTGVVPQWLARPLALGGTLVFVGALLYSAYCYVVTFGREVDGPLDRGAVIANVALFSFFALHHSIFARDAIRQAITQTVGSLERSFYVWVASLLFVAVCALWQPVTGTAWRVGQPAASILRAAQLVGVWLSLRSAFLIDIWELAGVRQISDRRQPDAASSAAVEFKRRGPYGWVRHPIYTGWFLMVFGAPVMTTTRFVFALTSSLYLLIAIPFEERSLRRSTGGAYDRYVRDVRWKLIPWVY
jgi:methanethiol S-methyltransferase